MNFAIGTTVYVSSPTLVHRWRKLYVKRVIHRIDNNKWYWFRGWDWEETARAENLFATPEEAEVAGRSFVLEAIDIAKNQCKTDVADLNALLEKNSPGNESPPP